MANQEIENYVGLSVLNKVFLEDALVKQARRVLDNQENVREAMRNSIISPEGWILSAKEALAAFGTDEDKAKYDIKPAGVVAACS